MKNPFQNLSQTNKDKAMSAFIGAAAITSQMVLLMNMQTNETLQVAGVGLMTTVAIGAFVAGKHMTAKFNMRAFAFGMFATTAVGTAAAIAFIDDEPTAATSSSGSSYQAPAIN